MASRSDNTSDITLTGIFVFIFLVIFMVGWISSWEPRVPPDPAQEAIKTAQEAAKQASRLEAIRYQALYKREEQRGNFGNLCGLAQKTAQAWDNGGRHGVAGLWRETASLQCASVR